MKVILLFGSYNLQLLDDIIFRLGWDKSYEKSKQSVMYWLPFKWGWNDSRFQLPSHIALPKRLLLYSRERIADGRWLITMLQSSKGFLLTSQTGMGAAWAVYKTQEGNFASEWISHHFLSFLLHPLKFQTPSRETNIYRDTMLIVVLSTVVYIFDAGEGKHVKAISKRSKQASNHVPTEITQGWVQIY